MQSKYELPKYSSRFNRFSSSFRQPTTIGGDAKQLAYEQALTLMSHRCVSKSSGSNRFRQSSALSSDLLFGPRNMKMVFIEQKNPVPMPPLKAWKGVLFTVYKIISLYHLVNTLLREINDTFPITSSALFVA